MVTDEMMRCTYQADGRSELYMSACPQEDFLCTKIGTQEDNLALLDILAFLRSTPFILVYSEHRHLLIMLHLFKIPFEKKAARVY